MKMPVSVQLGDWKIVRKEITAGDAEELLKLNSHNREKKTGNIGTIVGAIERGEWEVNGSTIVISDEGILLDGQNRLMAIVKSRVTCESLIVYGVHDSAQDTMDTNAVPRSFADILSMDGVKHHRTCATALKNVMFLETGTQKTRTIRQLKDDWETHKGLSLSAVRASDWMCFVSPAVVTTLHYLFSKKDPETATFFFDTLSRGNIKDEYCPINLLRKRLLSNFRAKQKFNNRENLKLIIAAWNANINGADIKHLNMPSKMPRILGAK